MNNTQQERAMWEIAIQWRDGITREEIKKAEKFVIEMNKDVNGEGEDIVPTCINAITISRI